MNSGWPKLVLLMTIVGLSVLSATLLAPKTCYFEHQYYGEFVGYGQQQPSAYMDALYHCRLLVPKQQQQHCYRSTRSCENIVFYHRCYAYDADSEAYFEGKGHSVKAAKLMAFYLCQSKSGSQFGHCADSAYRLCQQVK